MQPLTLPTPETLAHIQQRINLVASKLQELVRSDPRSRPDREALLQAAEIELDRLYAAKRAVLAQMAAREHRQHRNGHAKRPRRP
jgi:hypothetical protein